MVKILDVNGIQIGAGIPKIIVPLVSTNFDDLQKDLEAVIAANPDLIEWRADFYSELQDCEYLTKTLIALRAKLGTTPIIFTVRTSAEGGKFAGSEEEYGEILDCVSRSGCVEIIDVELFHPRAEPITKSIQERGGLVILSNHEFNYTPTRDILIDRLQKMQNLGGDILKIAVMPKSPEDLVSLLSATTSFQSSASVSPVATMSMGKLGIITRASGQFFGSSLTFASVGKTSAPGQIDINDLRQMLHIFDKWQ